MASSFRWIGRDDKVVTLRQFEGNFKLASYATDSWLAENSERVGYGVGVDVETTGLNAATDKVIEVGLMGFKYHLETGELLKVDETYSALEDPGHPLSPEIQRLTGISQADVEGKVIDWIHVDAILSKANLILAHNAGFDRAFLDRKSPASGSKLWGCSLSQVDWAAKGFNARKLEMLSIYHGFFTDAHRALADAEAMIHLLTFSAPDSSEPYLKELAFNAEQPLIRMIASQSPFESKDYLKGRGYRWDPKNRFWHKSIKKSQKESELKWLEGNVYGGPFKGRLEEIAPTDHFKVQ